MSARCTARVFERYPVGGGEMLLALALADNAHDDGTHIFIGVPAMAEKSRQSVRAVQAHLRRMQRRGWLLVTKPGGGRGRPTEYRISPLWLKGEELAPFSEPSAEAVKGADSAGFEPPERVQIRAQKGADSGTAYITGLTTIPPYPPAGGASGEDPNTPNPGSPGFDAIAAGYPRRAGIDAARRDWDELAPDSQLQAEIARGIQAWIPSTEWQRDGGRWIPKLGKFLRDKRWLDAPGIVDARPAAPALPPAPELTPEQLAANGEKARAAAAHARSLFGRMRSGAAA